MFSKSSSVSSSMVSEFFCSTSQDRTVSSSFKLPANKQRCQQAIRSVSSVRTFVDAGDFVLKVNKSRKVIQSVLFGLVQIADFDESDAVLVAFVVDVLQFFEGQQVIVGVFVVCQPKNRCDVCSSRSNGFNLQKRTAKLGILLMSISSISSVTSSISSLST